MSTSVTGASLIQLPSIDRDVSGILYYTPTTAPNFHGAEGNTTAGQVAGATSDQNLIYLDGGNNSSGLEGDNAYVNGGHGVVPMPMESVEEFKVNTNNMTADFNACLRRGGACHHQARHQQLARFGLRLLPGRNTQLERLEQQLPRHFEVSAAL